MTHPTDVDVLIVGAGPTGLTLACLLAQFGVNFKIIEKNSAITEHSNAIAIQARTLELLEQLDLAEIAIGQGYTADGLNLVARGKVRASFDLHEYGNGLTKYPFVLVLEQNKTEKLLVDKLESFGKKVEWQHELIDLAQHSDSVSVSIAQGMKITDLRAKYIVAADGAHSVVRSLLRLPFDGDSFENRFLLADVQIQGPISRQRISLCLSPSGFSAFFPMPGADRFRAISIWPSAASEKQEAGDSSFIASEIRTQAQLPLSISDLRWFSVYRTHHRNVRHFKEQRCFFAGDAAHVHSPAGGQGMNTGIQDAFNLAWKIFYVFSGRAQAKLLETYHDERFPVARNLIRILDKVFLMATDKRPAFRWFKLVLAPSFLKLASHFVAFRTRAFKLISQIGVQYYECSLNHQAFLTKGVLRAGDRFYLSGCPPGKFRAFMVGPPGTQEHAKNLLEKFFENEITFYTLDKRPDLHSILQTFGIHKDGFILIRPDGYVCYCSEGLDLNSLLNYLNRYFFEKGSYQETDRDQKEAFPFESFI